MKRIRGILAVIILLVPGFFSTVFAEGLTKADAYTVNLSANKEEFGKGESYSLSINVTNQDGHVIPAGTQLVIDLPKDAVDYQTLDLSDANLTNYFTVTITDKIVLTVKQDIVGDSTITGIISGEIIGTPGTSYPLTSSGSFPNGDPLIVNVANPEIKVTDDSVTPPPVYGLLNMYWGLSDNEKDNFIGKDPNGSSPATGIFNRVSDHISNFVEINPKQSYNILDNYHYKTYFDFAPENNSGSFTFDISKIKVTKISDGTLVDPALYTVKQTTSNRLTVEFQSADESGHQIGGTEGYRISYLMNVTNDSIVYASDSALYVVEGQAPTGEANWFHLKNVFSPQGASDIFPNLIVEDKIYYVNELDAANIEQRLLENITAKDTNDGEISKQVQVDYLDLLSKVAAPGEYPDQVYYTVENSTGHVSTRPVKVTILDKGTETTEPSTTEPSTTEPSTTDTSTTEPSTTEPSTTEPSTTEPSTTDTSTTEPSTTEPSTTEPSTTEPSTTEPSTTEPSTTEPSTTEPSTTEPSTTEPSTTEPSTTEPSTTEPSTTEPSTTDTSTTEPSTTETLIIGGATNDSLNGSPTNSESGRTYPKTGEKDSLFLVLTGVVTLIGSVVILKKR